jgi:hypothetical protein
MPSSSSLARRGVSLGAGLLALGLCSAPALGQSPGAPSVADQGYSFVIGLGRLDHRYKEFPGSQPVHSQVRTQTPILVSGAVYAVSPDLMFSLGSEVTFFPDTATETCDGHVHHLPDQPCGMPGKLTMRLHSVRPISSAGSLRLTGLRPGCAAPCPRGWR